jgi:hypothetical protein
MESRPELIATYFTLAGNVRPLTSDNSSQASLAERAVSDRQGRDFLQAIASLPGGIVNHVELDDGALLPAADYLTDTISHRLAPGEGEFPCKAFVEAIAATGYRGLFGVEILSDDYRRLSAMEAAQCSYIATMGLFD